LVTAVADERRYTSHPGCYRRALLALGEREMQREAIEVELSPEERSLILRYGYPFDRIKQALEVRQKSRTIEIVPLDAFELERLVGDLSRSSNDMAGGSLQNALLDLCERLEAAEQYGSGALDEI
jgi:hypothetical protein